jgi:hypothetical protein
MIKWGIYLNTENFPIEKSRRKRGPSKSSAPVKMMESGIVAGIAVS